MSTPSAATKDWFQIAQETFDWPKHTVGDRDCKGCEEETNYSAGLEPYPCSKNGCPGLVHYEFAGENYDEETNDAWPEYVPCCDICERKAST